MPQSGYEFRATKYGAAPAWKLVLPGRRLIATGVIGLEEPPAKAMRRARHFLGYTPCRRARVYYTGPYWSWRISTSAGITFATGAYYASAEGARRGLRRARAAARGARIVMGRERRPQAASDKPQA